MKYYQKLNNQKGVSLYLAISIMAVLLAIVFGLNAILINQIKTTGEIEKSVVAFFAADTGIERVLKEIKNDEPSLQDSYSSVASDFTNPDVSYEVKVTCSLSGTCAPAVPPDVSCISPRYCIKSIGTFRGIKRAIELTFGSFQSGVTELFEFNDPQGATASQGSSSSNFALAQTFTVGVVGPNESFRPEFVRLSITNGFPDDCDINQLNLDVIVSIQNINSATGFPEGADLCVGSIPSASVPPGGSGIWSQIDLLSCPILDMNTTYALVVTGPGADWPDSAGDWPDCIFWGVYQDEEDVYPGGISMEFFQGSWSPMQPPYFDGDYLFEIWGPVSSLPRWKEVSPF